MSTTPVDLGGSMVQASGNTIRESLSALESILQQASEWPPPGQQVNRLAEELRVLHARVRTQHAAGVLSSAGPSAESLPPQYVTEFNRLQSEHSHILGMLDRLLRSVDTLADSAFEDSEVFMARARELIAVLRRHEAEDDRLFYLAVWRDTGGGK